MRIHRLAAGHDGTAPALRRGRPCTWWWSGSRCPAPLKGRQLTGVGKVLSPSAARRGVGGLANLSMTSTVRAGFAMVSPNTTLCRAGRRHSAPPRCTGGYEGGGETHFTMVTEMRLKVRRRWCWRPRCGPLPADIEQGKEFAACPLEGKHSGGAPSSSQIFFGYHVAGGVCRRNRISRLLQIQTACPCPRGGVLEGGGLNDGDLTGLASAGGVAACTQWYHGSYKYSLLVFWSGRTIPARVPPAGNRPFKVSYFRRRLSLWCPQVPQTGTPAPSAPAAPRRRS